MSFHIHPHEAPGDGFRRVLCGQLERAIKELSQSSPGSQAAAVHSARKRIKRIRTVLRLLRRASPHGKPDPSLASLRAPLREAARELALMRDVRVDEKTLTKLCKDFSIPPARIAKAFEFLKQRRIAALSNGGERMHKAVLRLTSVRQSMEKPEPLPLDPHDVRNGVAAIYKRGRASFRKSADKPSAANFHRCRKRTKDILHMLLLLKETGPKSLPRREDRARKLCSLLGREHDLAHLRATLDQGDIGVQSDMLDELIVSKRLKLQRKIMKLGAKFFAKKPKNFAAKCLCG